ncbi:MAG: hypothetical protein EA406_00705 [Rhodospirillales bacterium]|nr:MAG: hypothetical protein EA406_00705 [Rhodospirillales bacterium]
MTAKPRLSRDGRHAAVRVPRLLLLLVAFLLTACAVTIGAPVTLGASEPEPPIRVRTGEHPGFSRIVFDWPQRVEYALWREGTLARVMFSSPARFDLSRVGAVPARRIRAVSPEAWLDGSAVVLAIPDNASVTHMRVGTRVVIDVWSPRVPRQADVPQVDAEPPAEAASEPSLPPGFAIPTEALPGVVTEPPAEPESPDQPTDREGAAETPSRIEETHPGPVEPDPDEGPGPEVSPLPAPDTPAPPEPERGGDAQADLRMDWAEPVAGAAFRRGPWIWLVFDRASEPDVGALRQAAGPAVDDLHQVASDNATVLRLKASSPSAPRVRRDGAAWLVRILPEAEVSPPRRPIEPVIDVGSTGEARLLLPVDNPSRPIPLTDPEVGDNFLVVALSPPGIGIVRTWQYPELELSATAQGIVIRPKVDDLRVLSNPRGVVISRPQGLKVSPVGEAERRRAELRLDDTLKRVLEPESWPTEHEGEILARARTRLTAAAVTEDAARRERALLRLAQFELAHGLTAESLGALGHALHERAGIADEARFRLLRGMALAVFGRLDEAEAELKHGSLDASDEGSLWRAAVTAWQGDLAGAAADLGRTRAIAQSYPRALRVPLATIGAEAALADGRTEDAEAGITLLEADVADDARTAPMLAYLRGRLMVLRGDTAGALASLDQAARGRDRLFRAKALWAAAELRLKLGEITPDQALDVLEATRVAWRGAPLEAPLLRRLAELHGETGQYRAQLVALREAASRLRGGPGASEIAAEMGRIFADLFLGGGAEAMPPLAAIALFDEFRELTPREERGNDMIRRLADRLVAVDLLDRAAELLEDQVRNRLAGLDRARVGTRLSLVYLLDRRPADALAALEASVSADLPADLERQRRQITARALAGLERFDEATGLLAGDDSIDAERIRIEVAWERQDWPAAASALGRLAEAVGVDPDAPLRDDHARLVFNRAIALTLAGDDTALADLQQRFGPAMADTPFQEPFRLLTGGDGRASDVRTHLAATVDGATGFQAFLAGYRDRLREDGLSAIN